MGVFRQNSDGVFVSRGDDTYTDSLSNFALDHRSPAPALDNGVTERLYEQDVRHALLNGHDVVGGGPVPWDVGDAIIASLPALLAAGRARDDAILAAARAVQAAEAAARAAAHAPIKARNDGLLAEVGTADLVQQLKHASSAQIDMWVELHVRTLAEARDVLKLIVKIIATQID